MTTAKDFLKALQATGRDDVRSVDAYWARQRNEWVADLADLRQSIVGWLAPVREAKLATWKDVDFTLTEPDTGPYVAPGLEIALLAAAPRTVVVRPRGVRVVGLAQTDGARVVGARGRVDLECGVAREILLRFKNDGPAVWVSFSGGERRELDEDLFFHLVARLADIDLK
jgi:hypothetical protein